MDHGRPNALPTAPPPLSARPQRRRRAGAAALTLVATLLALATASEDVGATLTPTFSASTRPDGSETLAATASSSAAANYQWSFGDGTAGTGRTVVHSFAKPGIYRVTLTVSQSGGASGSATSEVTVDPASVYAPLVYLAPGETLYPDDVPDFLAHSALYWQNGKVRAGGATRTCAPTLVSTEAQLDPVRLGGAAPAVPYRQHAVPATVLAGSEPCQPTGTLYSTRIFTTPQNGRAAPQGFYLDLLPAGAGADAAAKEGDHSLEDGMYFEYVPNRYVVFWFFYPYNDDTTLGVVHEIHEGDWEHVVVRLDGTDTATAVAYAQHACVQSVESWSALAHPAGSLASHGGGIDQATHPIVYSARGGHASYATTGTHYFACPGEPAEGFGDVTGRGSAWQTWTGEEDLKAQPWLGYKGAWGWGVGTKLHPWGPLGPFPGREGIVPAGW
ncbi:MAG TPA: PKD domain-containing protein [Gaiellaceae bacterium]|nr:PKD domain-containing protein [Gaiellaceae bacterium]